MLYMLLISLKCVAKYITVFIFTIIYDILVSVFSI